MIYINRNVTIVVVILVLVVIAGYLIWLRSRTMAPVVPQTTPEVTVEPTSSPEQTATPAASPTGKEATGSMKQKTSTGSTTAR